MSPAEIRRTEDRLDASALAILREPEATDADLRAATQVLCGDRWARGRLVAIAAEGKRRATPARM